MERRKKHVFLRLKPEKTVRGISAGKDVAERVGKTALNERFRRKTPAVYGNAIRREDRHEIRRIHI